MLTYEELSRLAGLSKLSLDGQDTDDLIKDIGNIIEFAGMISEADVSGLSADTPSASALREDIPAPSVDRGLLLKNAAESYGGYFVAPKEVDF